MNAAPDRMLAGNRFPQAHIFRSIAESSPNVPPVQHRWCYEAPAHKPGGFARRWRVRIPLGGSPGERSGRGEMRPDSALAPGLTTEERRRSLRVADVAAAPADLCAWRRSAR